MMKKLFLLAAACVALAACNNKADEPAGTPFEAGQQVTIGVTAGGGGSQVAARRISGTDNGSTVDFTWDEGDKILVKVGNATAEFMLSSGAGTANAEFTGTMPAGGSTYDIQYPVETPNLSNQTYEANKIPADKMLFTATGCQLGENVSLQAQYAILQLSLKSSTDKSITKIVVENADDANESYTITTSGVTLTETATTFYLVVKPMTAKLTVKAYTGDEDYYSHTTTNAQTLTAGNYYSLPEQDITAWTYITGSCLAAGMRILMADGTTKKVEDIVKGDWIRTFDHEAGRLSSSQVCYAIQEEGKRLPVHLHFASGNTLTIAGQHGLLEKNSRKYVLVHQGNVASQVGKSFYNAQSQTWDQLVSYELGSMPVNRYAIYSAHHLNVIAEQMLTVEDDVDYLLNIYELDAQLKADPAHLAADIAQYGLADVADYPELAGLEEEMDAFNFKYHLIAVGKGLVTLDELHRLFESTEY